jgi:hypothetical protein
MRESLPARPVCEGAAPAPPWWGWSPWPIAVDRAEAWRRADAHFASGSRSVPLVVEEFWDEFVVRRALDTGDDVSPLLVVGRESGVLARWPSMPFDILAHEYEHYRKGASRPGSRRATDPSQRVRGNGWFAFRLFLAQVKWSVRRLWGSGWPCDAGGGALGAAGDGVTGGSRPSMTLMR